MVDVHLVLQQFDDRHDEVGIAQPAEHVVEHRHILVLDALGDTVRERRQHHAGDIRMCGLHLAGHGERIVVGITRHTDHQIDIGGLQYFASLLRRRHLRERGWIAHTEFHILIEDLLVDAAVILEHECIVGISHNKNIEDASRHQIDERHILQIEFIPFLWYLGYFFHIWLQSYEKIPESHCAFEDFFETMLVKNPLYD